MAGVFRFSNAVSNIDGIISTYKQIYNHFQEQCSKGLCFDHNDVAKFLAENGLASSLGAIGREALERSTRDDKSRDPLYNQSKAYSEMYRMLGWYEPGTMRTNFRLTEYGSYIAETDSKDIVRKLFEMNVLHISSPNPMTEVRGGNVLRPFAFILKLMLSLGGWMSRDEMILGVLACQNDTIENVLERTTNDIMAIREKGLGELDSRIISLRASNNLGSAATLQNYTRFPIAVLKWLGWAESKSNKVIYPEKSIKMLQLTDLGESKAKEISFLPDIRYSDIEPFESNVKCAFVILSNLYKLESIGFDVSVYSRVIPLLRRLASPILDKYCIDRDFLFFGYQESPREVIIEADKLLDSIMK